MMRINRSLLPRKVIVIGSAVLLLACLSIAVLVIYQNTHKNVSSDTPAYQTILPSGKSITELGGWSRISPPENDPVFAYTDNIGTVSISVSEQPYPASFKGDVDNKVAELAKAFSATNVLKTDDTKVYVGTSAKGPQSVIFAKNNLLVLIKSQGKIEDKAWLSYIKSLN